MGLQALLQVVHGHAVDPWRALVASDLGGGALEISRFQHPLQQGRPFPRRVFSPCPRDGFIPRSAQGPLEPPHGCLAPARHDTTTPFLQAPLGAPYGPSVRPRCSSAYLLPRLSALGCRTSLACVGPTRPSADVCRPVRPDRSALSPLFPRLPADLPGSDPERSARRRRIDQAHPCGWRTSRARARSPRLSHPSSPVPVRRLARVDWAVSRPPLAVDALALLLAFGSAMTWHEDFHLARSVPCLAHTPGMSRRWQRERRRSRRCKRSAANPWLGSQPPRSHSGLAGAMPGVTTMGGCSGSCGRSSPDRTLP